MKKSFVSLLSIAVGNESGQQFNERASAFSFTPATLRSLPSRNRFALMTSVSQQMITTAKRAVHCPVLLSWLLSCSALETWEEVESIAGLGWQLF